MSGTTVRIRDDTHVTLRELARTANEPMQEVLAKAVEAYRRQRLIEESNAAYARLYQDPQAWAELQDEQRLLDGTLADGLEPE